MEEGHVLNQIRVNDAFKMLDSNSRKTIIIDKIFVRIVGNGI